MTEPESPRLGAMLRSHLESLQTGAELAALQRDLQATAQKVKVVPGAIGDKLVAQVVSKALARLEALLDIDLARDVVARAWARLPELQAYRDAVRYPPAELFRAINVVEQTIRSQHAPSVRPVVEILGRTFELDTLAFPTTLDVHLRGGELLIQAGAIVGVSMAECKVDVNVDLRYGEAFQRALLREQRTLPERGAVRFQVPVPIGG